MTVITENDKTFDPKCLELAAHFIDDGQEPKPIAAMESLAQAIQSAIEDWFENSQYLQ